MPDVEMFALERQANVLRACSSRSLYHRSARHAGPAKSPHCFLHRAFPTALLDAYCSANAAIPKHLGYSRDLKTQLSGRWLMPFSGARQPAPSNEALRLLNGPGPAHAAIPCKTRPRIRAGQKNKSPRFEALADGRDPSGRHEGP